MGKNTALLVIDVQRGLFAKSTPVYHGQQLLDTINGLVARAHEAGAPVAFVQHENESYLAPGTDDWQLHSSLEPLQGDLRIRKRHGSSFQDTDLKAELAARGVTRVVIAGLVSHGCVKATCEDALRLGYETVLVRDGHSSYSRDAAQLIETWNQRLELEGAAVVLASEVEF